MPGAGLLSGVVALPAGVEHCICSLCRISPGSAAGQRGGSLFACGPYRDLADIAIPEAIMQTGLVTGFSLRILLGSMIVLIWMPLSLPCRWQQSCC